jgi:hypothetical protein
MLDKIMDFFIFLIDTFKAMPDEDRKIIYRWIAALFEGLFRVLYQQYQAE